jgi:hypothetical protein
MYRLLGGMSELFRLFRFVHAPAIVIDDSRIDRQSERGEDPRGSIWSPMRRGEPVAKPALGTPEEEHG